VASGHVQHPAFAESALGLDAARRELLGRREEQRRLAALLHEAREGQAGVLVLRGEAGIGKPALLSDLAGNAVDFCLCRTAGVESEMELAYAGLQQLCRPLAVPIATLAFLASWLIPQVELKQWPEAGIAGPVAPEAESDGLAAGHEPGRPPRR
jgi:hypothetical protein